MLRLMATYLSYKWAMRTVNSYIKDIGEQNYGYSSKNDFFLQEYKWMYNILNPTEKSCFTIKQQ